MARELSSADVAARHGISRKSAWRWLKELHEKYGDAVVTKRGKRGVFVTSEKALSSVIPLVHVWEHERRFKKLEERVSELERRLDEFMRMHRQQRK